MYIAIYICEFIEEKISTEFFGLKFFQGVIMMLYIKCDIYKYHDFNILILLIYLNC